MASAVAAPARVTQGFDFLRFVAEYGRHPDGELVGQPLVVHEWWQQTMMEILEWVRDPATGLMVRRYSEGFITLPKGQAKTCMMAHLGLFLLIADRDPNTGVINPAPMVISAAASEEQGQNLLFGAVKTIVEHSPGLAQLLDVFEREIVVRDLPRARMKNITSKAGTQDGAQASGILCDELHQWKGQRGRDLFHILSGAASKRRNSMIISITTAGDDETSLCREKYDYARQVQTGQVDDPGFYGRIVEAPEGADYKDPAVWAACNPLLGVSVQASYIADRVKREPENVVRRFHLNNWVAAERCWIEPADWDALADTSLQLDPARPLWAAIDISQNIDSSAVAMVQNHGTADEPRYVLKAQIWSNPYRPDSALYKSWRMNNFLVMEFIRELFATYPVPAGQVDRQVKPGIVAAFDPWRFRPEALALIGEGINCHEFSQSDAKMVPASQCLFEAIKNGTLHHDGDPVLRAHVLSATAEQKQRGWRLSKPEGSTRKIDAAVAAAIALWCCQSMPAPTYTSIYEVRDLLVL